MFGIARLSCGTEKVAENHADTFSGIKISTA
jgi:hypothetical protein